VTTPKDESETQQVSHSIENGVPVDIVEGQARLDPIKWEARVPLPPFEQPPKVTVSPYSLPTFDEPGPAPDVLNVTRDRFELKGPSGTSATIWKWRAEGKLAAPVEDPARAARKRKRGPDPWTIAGVIAGVIGAIAAVLALFMPEFRHFFHLP
jgi:hypothetical protein